MSTFDYSRPLAAANRMIERYGQTGAVRRLTASNGPAFDPGQPEPDDHTARFVIVAFMANEIDGTRIHATDKKALLAPGALTIIPTPDDLLVEADGSTWKIVPPVDVLRPAETTLLYTLQVRR